jgi:hypothetical protein
VNPEPGTLEDACRRSDVGTRGEYVTFEIARTELGCGRDEH